MGKCGRGRKDGMKGLERSGEGGRKEEKSSHTYSCGGKSLGKE